ncbi:hypothetical protein IOLA_119 [uncultured bacterium]|nr:hypothetical protein IOLA_119 [uncultured bacterium]
MSYLSDKIVANIARSTSFMSDNLSNINRNLIEKKDNIIIQNNDDITNKLLANNKDESSSEILIGFDISKIIKKFQLSFNKTRDFFNDSHELVQNVNEIHNFLESNAGQLYSNLILFNQVLCNAYKSNYSIQDMESYKYMQKITDKVILSLSNLLMKLTEKSDDFLIVKEKLINLISSLHTFINIYKSAAHLFNQNKDTSYLKYEQEKLIDILYFINSNSNYIEKYMNITSKFIRTLSFIKKHEIQSHLKNLSNNNVIINDNSKINNYNYYIINPSYNWQLLYNLSNQFKENYEFTNNQYSIFLIEKIKNEDINVDDIKTKIRNMDLLTNQHIELVNKYKIEIYKYENENFKKMQILSNTINEIKNYEKNKELELLSILKLKVNTLNVLNSAFKISISALSLSYNIIRLDDGINNFLVKIFKNLYCIVNYVCKIIFDFIYSFLNWIYIVLSKIILLCCSLLIYIINTIFSISLYLYMNTLFTIIMPSYENLIECTTIIPIFFNNIMFLFKI